MNGNILEQLFKHNNWANEKILEACAALTDEQLDAEADQATKGSIRQTLWHLIDSQQDYLYQLTNVEPHFQWETAPGFAELGESAKLTGEGLLTLAENKANDLNWLGTAIFKGGHSIQPWVLMVQAINHATEHREQIKSMLSALGASAPRIDGWEYGRVTGRLVRLPK